jgi:hypothetical protein
MEANKKVPATKKQAPTATDKPAAETKETITVLSPRGETKIKLVRDAYGKYFIGGHVGSVITVRSALAESMVDDGFAEIVK